MSKAPEAPATAPPARVEAEHRRELLRGTELFAALDRAGIDYLVEHLREVVLPAGAVLVRQGEDSRTAYVVTSGRLRVTLAPAESGGRERVVGEVLPGEVVGEMSLVADEPRSATLRAARDSVLLAIDPEQFQFVLEHHPRVLRTVLHTVVRRLRTALHGGQRRLHGVRAIAVVPAGTGAELEHFSNMLARALGEIGTTGVLDRARMLEALGLPLDATLEADVTSETRLAASFDTADVTSTSLDAPTHAGASDTRVSSWLQRFEDDHAFVVYVADPNPNSWTMRCLRQADRVLLVGHSDRSRHPGDVELAMHRFEELGASSGFALDKHLVLVQTPDCERPRETSAWLRDRRVAHHHHVRDGNARDFGRLARRLTGRGVLLTLGGGGARGLAHLGVFKALEECGVLVDAVAGTSAGALVGASQAYDWSFEASRARIAEHLVANSSPLDYTAPLTALVRGGRIARRLRATYGTGDVEDTWLPFLCVSCNITRGELMAHRHGPMWHAIRATISIPGVLPPVRAVNGDVLVDGGLVDNLPVALQAEDWPGSEVIAVSLRGEAEMSAADLPMDGVLSGWPSLRSRLNPFNRSPPQVPGLGEVILRSTDTGSTLTTRAAEARADLLLQPPVSNYALLDFTHMDALIEVGYAHAMSRIPAWLEARAARLEEALATP